MLASRHGHCFQLTPRRHHRVLAVPAARHAPEPHCVPRRFATHASCSALRGTALIVPLPDTQVEVGSPRAGVVRTAYSAFGAGRSLARPNPEPGEDPHENGARPVTLTISCGKDRVPCGSSAMVAASSRRYSGAPSHPSSSDRPGPGPAAAVGRQLPSSTQTSSTCCWSSPSPAMSSFACCMTQQRRTRRPFEY